MRITLAAFAALLVTALAAAAQVHSVTGVAADDRLNVRADIDRVGHFSEAAVIGSLPPDATGVAATGRAVRLGEARWAEILFGGRSGWVNARYLRRETLFPEEIGFNCGGTEPFWNIAFDGAGGTISALGLSSDIPVRLDGWQGGVGRPDLRVYRFTGVADGRGFTAIQRHDGACSDGMSDYDYAWEMYFLGLDPGGGVHHACCTAE